MVGELLAVSVRRAARYLDVRQMSGIRLCTACFRRFLQTGRVDQMSYGAGGDYFMASH